MNSLIAAPVSRSLPVALTFRPHDRVQAALYDTLAIVGGSLLVALLAQVSIPMWPVPITGSTLALLLVGGVLGARLGFLAVSLYLLEGALGMPVFAGFKGGFQHLLGHTGGFLIAFPITAGIVGYLIGRGWDRSVWSTGLAFVVGLVPTYALGCWVLYMWGFDALALGLYPFLGATFIKIAVAMSALAGLQRWRRPQA